MFLNQLQYKQICDSHYIPLFAQYWWVKAASVGKLWDVFIVYNHRNEIVAALPYHLVRKFGYVFLIMPPRTQLTGFWISNNADRDYVFSEFNSQLQKLRKKYKILYYYQQAFLSDQSIDLLKRASFIIKNRVTYRIPDLTNLELVYESFSKNKIRQIKKANNHVFLDKNLTYEEFYTFHQLCLEKSNKKIEYSFVFFASVYKAAKERGQCQILSARNSGGVLLASVFLVWDSEVCYFLIPSFDLDYKKTGAMAWLTFECIKFARGYSRIFDFEGSMDEGIANSYSQYGSQSVKYYSFEQFFVPFLSDKVFNFYHYIKNKIHR